MAGAPIRRPGVRQRPRSCLKLLHERTHSAKQDFRTGRPRVLVAQEVAALVQQIDEFLARGELDPVSQRTLGLGGVRLLALVATSSESSAASSIHHQCAGSAGFASRLGRAQLFRTGTMLDATRAVTQTTPQNTRPFALMMMEPTTPSNAYAV